MNKIGLIGAGLMGFPMAVNWLKKDFQLTVLPHKNMENINKLVALGAGVAKNIEDLVRKAEVIILMLPTSREVESVCDEILKSMQPTQMVIDMTTSEPESTKKIFQKFNTKNIAFFDCPVTGGVKGATEGTLTLFIGGEVEYYNKVKHMLSAVSTTQRHFGKTGNGHIAKIINNFICIGNLGVFAEVLPIAAKLGLNTESLLETLQAGTAASRMIDLYGEQILNGDFAPRFKMEHAYKDLKIAENLTQSLNVELPILKALFTDFEKSKSEGYFKENISALIRPYENKLGAFFRKKESKSD